MTAIDNIKNIIPIEDVLERYTDADFKKAKTGRLKFNIRCPFHHDRNPSLTIYKDTNTFRCWSGCNNGKHGDVIDIVRLSLNMDTKEALKTLITDYGLKNPNSEQAKEWRKIREYREQAAALIKGLNKKVIDRMGALKEVKKAVVTLLSTIRKVEDMERLGELYHVVVQIEYWLDCLIEDNPVIQVQTLQEVSRFLKKLNTKVGEIQCEKYSRYSVRPLYTRAIK